MSVVTAITVHIAMMSIGMKCLVHRYQALIPKLIENPMTDLTVISELTY